VVIINDVLINVKQTLSKVTFVQKNICLIFVTHLSYGKEKNILASRAKTSLFLL